MTTFTTTHPGMAGKVRAPAGRVTPTLRRSMGRLRTALLIIVPILPLLLTGILGKGR